ncbi:GNAT family N-acetyltransferase [Lactiplantibacillus sp. WILCCON 0030]|uniref:GNAT family N-acetyltransferase n=1 Tax=Lactiplantibacillus brownii TaxID=3069269 RepID=A0ABU1ACN8_9LACO|nr:GNAT family N-acetyltransferase [Lactiplantibacillus brownii]MDQ7938611.1 GNAT family N-acetyltransferase [Lactiplantibacillus brownii]
MPKLEKYHPILTPHYTFDWLTKARVKDVLTLIQETDARQQPTILSVADRINQTMREIFHDQKLVWGITQRTTDQLIGIAGFTPLDLTANTATLTVTVLPAQQQPAVLAEIYTRLTAFATHELGLTQLSVHLSQPDQSLTKIFTELGFSVMTTDPLDFKLTR